MGPDPCGNNGEQAGFSLTGTRLTHFDGLMRASCLNHAVIIKCLDFQMSTRNTRASAQ